MTLTVREVLQLEAFRNTRVLAGKNALDREVRYVDTMEVPVADMKPWLRADELLLTTAYAIRDDSKALVSLVQALAEAGAAGLLLKSARFIGETPTAVIETANSLDFPIIEIPKELPFIDVTHSILKEILGRQARSLEYSNQMRHALTKVELEGTGLLSIAETVSDLLGNEVAITDAQFRVVAWSRPGPRSVADEALPGWLDMSQGQKQAIHRLLTTETFASLGSKTSSGRVRPVRVKDKTLGYLFVREDRRSLTEMELIALEHASTTVALEMMKRQALDEVRRRMEMDFFDELLMGNIRSREMAAQRARSLGYPQSGAVTVVLVQVDDFDSIVKAYTGEMEVQEIKDTLTEAVRALGRRRNPKPVVVSRHNSAICVLPLSHSSACGPEGLAFAKNVQESLRATLSHVTTSIGISYVCKEPLEFPARYREAETAIAIARAIRGAGAIGYIGDLEAYRLFYEHPDRSSLSHFVSKSVKPLQDYDESNGTDLFETLCTILVRSTSNNEAAKRLHVHRNTLTHRLNQIKELLGVDLSNPEQRFTLELAVRAALFCREENR